MLHHPHSGHKMFEVGIYNREVRNLVKENKSHALYDDVWADVHRHDVEARDEDHARSCIEERFPSEDGFVVTDITEQTV